MKKIPFRSGVHPQDGKELSKGKRIRKLDPPELLCFPMSQHIGAPATPLVKPGDRVLRGQMIGQACAFVSSPVFSSVSGIVKSVGSVRLPGGKTSLGITVRNDGKNELAPGVGDVTDPNEISTSDLAGRIADSGIVGMGGAGFPTGVKLKPKDSEKIDYLIINGAECEPYITSDYRLMIEQTGNIIMGAAIVLRLFKNARAVIAIEDNKPDAIKAFESQCNELRGNRISVKKLKTRYPQGAERRLIASVTGRKINSKMLPADAGCIVMNIATVFAVYEAICCSLPLMHRIVTVTGTGAGGAGNFDVPLGTPVSYLAEQVGGLNENAKKIISGGPMMGIALDGLDYPVTKTFSCLLALDRDDVAKMRETACIRCGRCIGVCPENLTPVLMADAAKTLNSEKFIKLHGMECIECGCCSYICPAKRPLTQSFKLMKNQVRTERAAEKAAQKKEA